MLRWMVYTSLRLRVAIVAVMAIVMIVGFRVVSRTTGVLKIANVKKAMRLLQQNHKKNSKSQPVVRRSRSSRK
jgi:hypothetical protein